MRFEEAYGGWQEGRLTQEEAARLLGVVERTFRRYVGRYDADGLDGLIDHRLNQVSHRRAPVDEVMRLVDLYASRYPGFNVRHFFSKYRREHEGARSYSWVKNTLQAQGQVGQGKQRGAHRKRRTRAPLPGMLVHQDGSRHEWGPGQQWDLIATMDDATSAVYSLFFVGEEGTMSSFHGVAEVIRAHGLFCSLYTDRGSHDWLTPEAGGKVDKAHLTQFGRAMKRLGIEMIAAYSPEARGRSERLFKTLQDRLPKELALAGITTMDEANRFVQATYVPEHNAEFAVPAAEAGSAFVPWVGGALEDVLCVQEERVVGNDNCVRYAGRVLQIPADAHRCHYVKARVRVHDYPDGRLAVFHGPRCLARYGADRDGAASSTPAVSVRLASGA
jgi:hypothetical protein